MTGKETEVPKRPLACLKTSLSRFHQQIALQESGDMPVAAQAGKSKAKCLLKFPLIAKCQMVALDHKGSIYTGFGFWRIITVQKE